MFRKLLKHDLPLTESQTNLRDSLIEIESEITKLTTARKQLLSGCVEHVYGREGQSAVCVICASFAGWYCEKAPDHVCEMQGRDVCIYCGQHHERR